MILPPVTQPHFPGPKWKKNRIPCLTAIHRCFSESLHKKTLSLSWEIDDPMAAWRLMVFLCFVVVDGRESRRKTRQILFALGINWSVGVSNLLCILYNLSIINIVNWVVKKSNLRETFKFKPKTVVFFYLFPVSKNLVFSNLQQRTQGSQRHSPSQGEKWRPLISTTHFCHEAWATWFFVVGRDVKGFTKKQNKKTPMKFTVILDVSCCVEIFCWQLIFSHVWRVPRLKLQNMSKYVMSLILHPGYRVGRQQIGDLTTQPLRADSMSPVSWCDTNVRNTQQPGLLLAHICFG